MHQTNIGGDLNLGNTNIENNDGIIQNLGPTSDGTNNAKNTVSNTVEDKKHHRITYVIAIVGFFLTIAFGLCGIFSN